MPVRQKHALLLNRATQQAIDSLKLLQERERRPSSPVNPNYMSDYQAYRLGLPLAAVDSIRSFRNAGGTIQTIDGFKAITKLPDSMLQRLTSQLRFPARRPKPGNQKASKPLTRDLNTATAEDLRKIYGIGPKLSARIVKFRHVLGGFLQNEQLYDVYGLDSAVVRRLLRKFVVKRAPQIEKISINTASVTELAANVYISWALAREIVSHRQRHGPIESWSDLKALKHLPEHKIARIRLYLNLEKKLLE